MRPGYWFIINSGLILMGLVYKKYLNLDLWKN